MTTDIKIKEELWNLIVSGEKTTEFRKLCKGYKKGTYRFVSIELKETIKNCKGCTLCKLFIYEECPNDKKIIEPLKVFGTATLTPNLVNPKLHINYNKYQYSATHCYECEYELFEIDKLTYDFVTEHYVDKHDFIAYDITDVKDLR